MFCFGLVQERHIGQRAALGLGVHDDPMPERQCDGGVVAVTHRAAGVNTRVALHYPPVPTDCVGIVLADGAILVRRDAVWITIAHANCLTARAEDLFHEMRLARSTTERFVTEDEIFIHHERRFGHEEPFALPAKCAVLASVTLA